MKNKHIIIIVLTLMVLVSMFALLNRNMVKDKKILHDHHEVVIKEARQNILLSFSDINQLGEEEFTAHLKSSGQPAKEHLYTGVPAKSLFQAVGIDLKENQKVTVRAVDGYTVTLNSEEILDEDNVYLAYQIDRENIPYQIILRKDEFSQRWCKDVVEMEIND